jgi:hypothetical protein
MAGVAQPTEKVRLVCLATGEVHEAWPVDAREHLAAGDFVRESDYVPPTVTEKPREPTGKLPPVGELAAHLATLEADAVIALQAKDDRKSVAPLYEARLAELAK